jgi:regulator of sirC expression with transglutaminase-like and TPR domain
MKTDSASQQQEALSFLRQAGEKTDEAIDLTEGAFALAVLDRPGVETKPYRAHLDVLIAQARTEGDCTRLDDQLRLIRRILVVQNKYHGDEDHFDDPRNANLMQVIDRRRGSPITLGIIYMHIAKALGWSMTAVDFAGYFFLKLAASDGEVLLDPFRAGQTCSPEYLQELLAQDEGQDGLEAEEADDFDESDRDFTEIGFTVMPIDLGNRDILLRLQNAIKRRHLSQEKVDAAISTLQRMILLAPRQEDLWRELGYLQAERGSLRAAITALEVVCDLSGEYAQARQTEDLLKQLRRQLN